MLHKSVLPTSTDFGGVQHFFEGHGEFSLGRLCVAHSRLSRRRGTVAIKPEARRQIYWTIVSIDTLVPIGATSASRSKDMSLRETRECCFRRTNTNVQLHTRVGQCILVF